MKYLFTLSILCSLLFCAAQSDSIPTKLNHVKQLFMDGTINEQEYNALRAKILGISTPATSQPTVTVKQAIQSNALDSLNSTQAYTKGVKDAGFYYHKTGGAFAGTFVTTIFTGPIFGLIPAIACSSTTPHDENLDYPSSAFMKNDDYKNGYLWAAHKEKKREVWTAWGVGTGIDFVIGLTVGLVVKNHTR